MPHEAAAALELRRARHFGLRLAFAVSVGFTISVASGSPLPFLGPMLALQFLSTSPRPLPLSAAVVMFGVVFIVGSTLMLMVSLFGDRPAVLIALLALLYFLCFTAQVLGKALPIVGLVLTITTVTILLGMARIDLGQAMIPVLLIALGYGLLVAWAAHALFPVPSGAVVPGPIVGVVTKPLRRATANTAILIGAVLICLINPAFTTALVVPLTVISLLNQANVATDRQAITGLLVVNLVGGFAASIAFTILSLNPTLMFMFLILATVGLFFGGRASDPRRGRVFAGSLGIFLVLFGLGVSPIPTTAPESFQTRMGLVVIAILYAIVGIGLLWRLEDPAGTDAARSGPASSGPDTIEV